MSSPVVPRVCSSPHQPGIVNVDVAVVVVVVVVIVIIIIVVVNHGVVVAIVVLFLFYCNNILGPMQQHLTTHIGRSPISLSLSLSETDACMICKSVTRLQ